MAVSNASVDHLSLPVLLVAHLEDRFPGTLIAVHIPFIEKEVLKQFASSELDTRTVDGLEYLLSVLTVLYLDGNEAYIVDYAVKKSRKAYRCAAILRIGCSKDPLGKVRECERKTIVRSDRVSLESLK